MAEKDFYSFEEALKELRLKEEELKRLVSEGEIRAFREGETMKLRKTDVENLRKELSGSEVVELGGTTEELVFEDDTDLDAGMKTEEISQADTIIEDDVEQVAEVAVEDEVVELEEDEDDIPVAAPVQRVVEVDEPVSEGMGMRAVLILTAFVLLLATPLVASLTSGHVTQISRSIAELLGQLR